MEPLLSIGITSYKRVNELVRCIKSIKTKYVDKIEILVSEDHSPLSEEISIAVNELIKTSQYHIVFSSNERNLGYDMNLGAILKKCSGKYVFFMSDDDAVFEDCLDGIINFLENNENKYGVLYAPFTYNKSRELDRHRFTQDTALPKGEATAAKCIYDAILFSGLIFRREWVLEYDASRFVNMNYFQVYMFLKMLYHKGGYYFSTPSVLCVADGENAYGLSESSGGNALLANRKSVISNLEFNKTLFKVIRLFDEEEKTNVFKSFEKQYSLRSYSGMSKARRCGKEYFNAYWNKLNSLDIKLYPITKIYYWMLLILGADLSNSLTSVFKKMVK